MLTVIFTRQSGEPPSLFGHSLFIVTTSSMGDSVPAGSAVIVRKTDINELKVKDIITFKDGYDQKQNLIINTHRVIRLNPIDTGLTVVTKGDNNNIEDSKFRYSEDIIGKVVRIIPLLGGFLAFVKSPIGLMTFIAIPLLLLLILEVINLLMFYKNPKEEIIPQTNQANLFGTHSGNPSSPSVKKQIPISTENVELINEKTIDNLDTNIYNTQKPIIPIKNTNYVTKTIEVSDNENETSEPLGKITTIADDERVIQEPIHKITTINDDEIQKPPHKITTITDDQGDLYKQIGTQPIVTIQDEQPVIISDEKITTKADEEFQASIKTSGKDQFYIDGIDVKVQSNSIRLNLNENIKSRDISITVTDEYTNVIVDSKDYEVNFALFKDEADNEQKVIIQKKNK